MTHCTDPVGDRACVRPWADWRTLTTAIVVMAGHDVIFGLLAQSTTSRLSMAVAVFLWTWLVLLGSRILLSPVRLPLQLGQVLAGLAEGIGFIDDRDRIVFANQAFGEITGRTNADLMSKCVDDLGWVTSSRAELPWHRVLRRRPVSLGDEQLLIYQHPDGQRRLLAITTSIVDAGAADITTTPLTAVTVRDATGAEHYRAEMENLLARVRRSREDELQRIEQLKVLVQEDPLTSCRNRRAMVEQCEQSWQHHAREGSPVACLMFDIDHFKSVNDQHGHATGDEVLRRVSECLRHTFAGVGHVYRYGGEEFCVWLPRHQVAEACWIGDRVRQSIGLLEIDNEDVSGVIRPTVSIGVSDNRRGAASPDEMISQADKCLYVAKRQGRNQVVAYDDAVAGAEIRISDRRD